MGEPPALWRGSPPHGSCFQRSQKGLRISNLRLYLTSAVKKGFSSPIQPLQWGWEGSEH